MLSNILYNIPRPCISCYVSLFYRFLSVCDRIRTGCSSYEFSGLVIYHISQLVLRSYYHDPQYRLSIAWQNVVYNKPPHPGFFLGNGMASPPRPNIYLIGKGEAIARIKSFAISQD